MARYVIKTSNDEVLAHHGIMGQKWGKKNGPPYPLDGADHSAAERKAGTSGWTKEAKKESKSVRLNVNGNPRRKELTDEQKEKVKKAIKIGAIAVGTGLAVYGTYRMSKVILNKKSKIATKKAIDYIDNNFLFKNGETVYKSGRVLSSYKSKSGVELVAEGRGSKGIGRRNAEIIAKGEQIYRDSMNTKLNKGLTKISNAGDNVANVTRKISGSISSTAKNSKNRVLDKINPIYEYRPSETFETVTRYDDNIGKRKITKTVVNYTKHQVKRK